MTEPDAVTVDIETHDLPEEIETVEVKLSEKKKTQKPNKKKVGRKPNGETGKPLFVTFYEKIEGSYTEIQRACQVGKITNPVGVLLESTYKHANHVTVNTVFIPNARVDQIV